jgi:SAM-dependent methyltransferase
MLGERLGIDALTYNKGVFWLFHHDAVANAPHLADAVLAEFPRARSLADIGCGTGGFAAEFQRRGLRVVGCEYSAIGRRWAGRAGVRVVPFDAADPVQGPLPDGPYDVAISLEVAEHVPAPLADVLIAFIAGASGAIVFTAAHPGQGGTGHVNEQPKVYWIEKFAARGFAHDDAAAGRIAALLRERGVSNYLHQNMMVFRRCGS